MVQKFLGTYPRFDEHDTKIIRICKDADYYFFDGIT